MKFYPTDHIKNIVLVGSAKSGKTTLAECMMYEGGVLSRMGSIDAGNTVSDFHPIEVDRGSSVYSSVLHTEWRGNKLNLIDTPGMDDFIGQIISALRVSDTALVTLNAAQGVEVGTEIIWRYLRRYHKPSVFVVNQLDHPKADFNETIKQAQAQFGEGVVLMQYPYQTGEGFNAIIDLLKMTMYQFPAEGGKPEKLPIPDDERERAKELHNTLVEAAAEHDDELMELYFEKGELDEDELRKGLRIGMLERDLFPVFCVSARQNMGSGRLMGFLGNVAPCAGDINHEQTTTGDELPISAEETTLFVFNATNEKHTGTMSFFKVCSGEVKAGQELYNNISDSHGKVNQLYVVDGKDRHPVDKLAAGDIGMMVKFKDTHVNHTLRSSADGVALEPINFPEAKLRSAVRPLEQKDEEKMAQALIRMVETDPTLGFEYAKELKQNIIHAQGELHLFMVKWELEHIHGVGLEYYEPRISYRETIQKPAKGDFRHKKQSGGAGQFAEVSLWIQPAEMDGAPPADLKVRHTEEHELPWGGKLIFHNCIVGGVIDQRFMPAILKGILEVLENGPITGSYVRDIAVYVYDGKMHAVDSNEVSFKIAGAQAFKTAFDQANPRLLEPMFQLEVLVPEEQVGDVMTDLQGRRGIVEGFNAEGNYQRISARVPLAELNHYATVLSSITQGRATHTRRFLEYSPVPRDVQQTLLAKHTAEPVS